MVGFFELASPASDVFSFGLLLWELSYARVVMQHLNAVQLAILRCSDSAAATPEWGLAPPDGLGTPTLPEPTCASSSLLSVVTVEQPPHRGGHCAAAAPSSEGVELVVTDQEHACSAVAAAQWAEIVDMMRQCWEMELEARPSAATLETRLQDLVLTSVTDQSAITTSSVARTKAPK